MPLSDDRFAVLQKAFFVRPKWSDIEQINADLEALSTADESRMLELIPQAKNIGEVIAAVQNNVDESKKDKEQSESGRVYFDTILPQWKNRLSEKNSDINQLKAEVKTILSLPPGKPDENVVTMMNYISTYSLIFQNNFTRKAPNPFLVQNEESSQDFSSKFKGATIAGVKTIVEIIEKFKLYTEMLAQKKDLEAKIKAAEASALLKETLDSKSEAKFNHSQQWLKLLSENKFEEADKFLKSVQNEINIDARDSNGNGALYYFVSAYKANAPLSMSSLAAFVAQYPSEKMVLNRLDTKIIEGLPSGLKEAVNATGKDARASKVNDFILESLKNELSGEGQLDKETYSELTNKYAAFSGAIKMITDHVRNQAEEAAQRRAAEAAVAQRRAAEAAVAQRRAAEAAVAQRRAAEAAVAQRRAAEAAEVAAVQSQFDKAYGDAEIAIELLQKEIKSLMTDEGTYATNKKTIDTLIGLISIIDTTCVEYTKSVNDETDPGRKKECQKTFVESLKKNIESHIQPVGLGHFDGLIELIRAFYKKITAASTPIIGNVNHITQSLKEFCQEGRAGDTSLNKHGSSSRSPN